MNCHIGRLSLFVVMATLVGNAVANEQFTTLYNLVNTSETLVNQSKEFVNLAQSSMQDKSKFEQVKENKIEVFEVLVLLFLLRWQKRMNKQWLKAPIVNFSTTLLPNLAFNAKSVSSYHQKA